MCVLGRVERLQTHDVEKVADYGLKASGGDSKCRVGSSFRGGEVGGDGAGRCRSGTKANGCVGDNSEGSFGSDQQRCQVVSGYAFTPNVFNG